MLASPRLPVVALPALVLLLLALGGLALYNGLGLVDQGQRAEQSLRLQHGLERAAWQLEQMASVDPAARERSRGALATTLAQLDAGEAASLLGDQALSTLRGSVEGLDGDAARAASLGTLLAGHGETAGRAGQVARQAAAQHARRLLVSASLVLALTLAVVAVSRWWLQGEVAQRRRAQAEVESSHHELNDTIDKLTAVSRNMQRLSAYASLLQSCQAVEEAIDITKISLSALLPDTAGSVYLLQAADEADEQGAVALRMSEWGEHRIGSLERLPPQDCWAMRRAQPFATDPGNAELRCAHLKSAAAPGEAATLCLPLNAQGESLGLLYLSGPAPLQGEELAVTAAEQLSMALANLRLKETLHNQSIRDALTGLFNRRYLEESLVREQSRANRQKRPLAVMMLDVDHFKRFNDSHGHPGGDALLGAVGKLLRQVSRVEDVPCRYGGEEFTVLMPETDAEAALAQAERIRLAIADLVVHHEGKPLSRVTASLGVAIYPQASRSMEGLMEAADAALYRAKSGGRNQVRLADGGGDAANGAAEA